jgi:hypothetical protein
VAVPGLISDIAETQPESAIPGRLDESVRDRILAEARGNPLALLELARAWTPMALAGGFGLPDNASVSAKIEEIFRRHLTPLSDDSRRMLLVHQNDRDHHKSSCKRI